MSRRNHGKVIDVYRGSPRNEFKKETITNFASGHIYYFSSRYLELTPNQRIRYIDQFEDPSMPEEMPVTISLRAVSVGTELSIIQENLPEVMSVEQAYLGWQESLLQLKQLVEAEVPAEA